MANFFIAAWLATSWNRLGYRLRSVLKNPPATKVPETAVAFENVHAVRARTADEPGTLRIFVGCKAKVKVGDFSRGGQARGAEALRALDHDTGPEARCGCRSECRC
jgi:hypothetical protein